MNEVLVEVKDICSQHFFSALLCGDLPGYLSGGFLWRTIHQEIEKETGTREEEVVRGQLAKVCQGCLLWLVWRAGSHLYVIETKI